MVYLDHNATTPLDPRVLEAMLPYLGSAYGNPSGLYRLGRLSRGAVDTAREQVAALVGAQPGEVVFTSGGTEANNLALKGLAFAAPAGRIVAGATEHPSVSEPLRFLAARGWRVEYLPVDRDGRPNAAWLDDVPAGTLSFATLMLANNETGVLHDLAALADKVRERGGWLHSDAVQAAGKIPIDIKALGVQLMSLSAHKLYGPKGVGALIVDRAVVLEPLLHGGGQERGLRGGTENVAAIVGFGKAAELALGELEQRRTEQLRLRRKLEQGLASLPGVTVFGERAERLPNTVQFALPGHHGEALVMNLDRLGFAVSSGSACASGAGAASPVLLAMGVDPDLARGAVRVSLGKDTRDEDVDRFLAALKKLVDIPIDP
ncbi:cysteine desulfurase family protein [Candidatus Methylocalor cossyra]|uniref:Cysteine desulfurase n=1 Tax=Candidatus Methylocalor cossyra TaxID=3108543 RepID=A0ABM9NGY5_9GAMM